MSNNVLDQADALMRRRRFVAGTDSGNAESPATDATTDDSAIEDVPILTDVVAQNARLPGGESGSPGLEAGLAQQVEQALRERLNQLLLDRQTMLAREIEAWLDEQMPQLVIRAMDGITDHLVALLANRAKDELLPRLEAALKPLDVAESDPE